MSNMNMEVVIEQTLVNAVTDLNIDNTGMSDVTVQLNSAFVNYRRIYLPAGTYSVGNPPGNPGQGLSLTLTAVNNGFSLQGAGPQATIISVSTSTSSGMVVHPDQDYSNFTLRDFSISRTYGAVPASSVYAYGLLIYGGKGAYGTSNEVILSNLIMTFHYVGYVLMQTTQSTLDDCGATNCTSHGFLFTNIPNTSTSQNVTIGSNTYAWNVVLQWTLINTFSINNNGWGYRVEGFSPPWTNAGSGPPFVVMNTWLYPYSNNNQLGGIAIVSSTTTYNNITTNGSINDVSIIGGWQDQDGIPKGTTDANQHPIPGGLPITPNNYGPGILLNTNGGQLRILDTHVEFAGSYGIWVDGLTNAVGNGDVQISGTSCFACNRSGIAITGTASFYPFGNSNPNANTAAINFISEVQIHSSRITRNNVGATNRLGSVPSGNYYGGIDFANTFIANTPYGGNALVTSSRVGNDWIPLDPNHTSYSPPPYYGLQNYGISVTSNVYVTVCDLTKNVASGQTQSIPILVVALTD